MNSVTMECISMYIYIYIYIYKQRKSPHCVQGQHEILNCVQGTKWVHKKCKTNDVTFHIMWKQLHEFSYYVCASTIHMRTYTHTSAFDVMVVCAVYKTQE